MKRNTAKTIDDNSQDKKYSEIQNNLADLVKQEKKITSGLKWYRNFDTAVTHEKLQKIEAKEKKLVKDLKALGSAILLNQGKITKTKRLGGSPSNLFDLLSPKKYVLRHKQKELSKIQLKNNALKRSKTGLLQSIRKEIETLSTDFTRYAKYNVALQENMAQELRQQIVAAKNDLADIAERKKQTTEKLAPLFKELYALESHQHDAESKLLQANNLENRLTSANNPCERAMVHKECERMFGDGKPRHTIIQQQNLLSRLSRDIEKLKIRLQEEERKASRIVAVLVIDGNNLCYESGNSFIGLLGIKALLPLLHKKAPSVFIVFDASIRRRLNSDDSAIRKQLDVEGATVHVVATRQSADETILDLASDTPNAYVLSRDRYAEFRDKKVVREDRIITCEIVARKVFVHGLDLSASF